jgi:hypothetical protein
MLKPLSLAVALGFSGVAIAQQAQPGPAGGASRPSCDVMSREEMQMCQRTKKGDASGVRSSLCDVVGADVIESCLKRPESGSSEAANLDQKQRPR